MFRKSHDGVRLALEPEAAQLLSSLLEQMLELLDAPKIDPADPFSQLVGLDQPVSSPDDPALLRLLPDAYRGDEQAAADFRRYTDGQLRGEKASNAQSSLDMLAQWHGAAVMDAKQARGWLLALNDLRLVLGTRLGVSQDDDLDQEDPSTHLYQWLSYLQDTLVEALTP